MPKPTPVIEFPARGRTYNFEDEYGVYEYGDYPQGSVNRGKVRRVFLGKFASLDDARRAYPTAGITESAANAAARLGY